MPVSNQCRDCEHYRGLQECDAYPTKIPQEIYSGLFDHTEPFPGDHGIQYERIDE